MKLYKILNENGQTRYGVGSWHLPVGKRPGKWMPKIAGALEPCENGYHLARQQDLVEWLGPEIFEAEYRGEIIKADNKVVVREARLLRRVGGWNEKTARLFAADCAERVLPIFEKERPHDDRPRKAIEAARAYARGEIDAAARDAAWAAVRAAARAAARDAARDAAWAAARAAAWAAARDAAWAVVRAAARDAARAAARAAARDAARAAARAAEREWQGQRLIEYLTGQVEAAQ